MISSWVTLFACIVFSLFIGIWGQSVAGFAILICAIVIPLLAAIINFCVNPTISVKIDCPITIDKLKTMEGTVEVKNKGLLSYRYAKINISNHNLLTDEELSLVKIIPLWAKKATSFSVCCKYKYCGQAELCCNTVYLYDFFGLTRKKVTVSYHKAVTVLPDIIPLSACVYNHFECCKDSSSYLKGEKGIDMSEIFDLRDYEKGDEPNKILWKLSSKYDKLIVKTGSKPTDEERTVVLCLGEDCDAKKASACAEVCVSLCSYLCDANVPFFLVVNGETFAVSSENDLTALLPKILARGKTYLPECINHHTVCITNDVSIAENFNSDATILLASEEKIDNCICFSSEDTDLSACDIII